MNHAFTFETEPFTQDSFGSRNLGEFEDEQSYFEWEEELRRGQRPPPRAKPSRSRPSGRSRSLAVKPNRPRPFRPKRPIIGSRIMSREPASVVGSEYVRWVQHCLNRAMDLRLPVTGVMGSETRSAIRNFQGRQGLAVSGIAGPETKEALKAACRRPPDETEEFELLAAGFDEPEMETALTAGGLESAEVHEPITRAIRAVNPTQPTNPTAQRIPRDRRNAIRAIDEALRGLDRIGGKIRNYPGIRPIEATGLILKRLNPVRQNLTAARGHLVAAAPTGQLLTGAQVNARFQAASNFLTQARRQWLAFLAWHRRRRSQHARRTK